VSHAARSPESSAFIFFARIGVKIGVKILPITSRPGMADSLASWAGLAQSAGLAQQSLFADRLSNSQPVGRFRANGRHRHGLACFDVDRLVLVHFVAVGEARPEGLERDFGEIPVACARATTSTGDGDGADDLAIMDNAQAAR
jgi:hypothetical protein